MRRIFILMFIAIAAMPATAQQFKGGLMAGIVASQVAGDTYSGYDKAGLFAGGFVRLPLEDRWALQMEMEYIQKGSRHNYDPDIPDDIDFVMRADYIEVPLLLQYDMSSIINHLFVQAGPAFAVLSSKKIKRDGENVTPNDFHTTNLSWVFGMFYRLGERWALDFRTDNSVFSIRKGEYKGYVRRLTGDYGQFHDALVISVFYQL